MVIEATLLARLVWNQPHHVRIDHSHYCVNCIWWYRGPSRRRNECLTNIGDLSSCLNTLRPRQNGRRFADDTFKRIFLNENARISIEVSLRFVPKGPINNIPALVQIMAWCRSGEKPLSEPMMVSLLTHICVTRLQWVNGTPYTRKDSILLNKRPEIFCPQPWHINIDLGCRTPTCL